MTLVCLPFPIKTNAVWYSKIDEVNKGIVCFGFSNIAGYLCGYAE